MRNLLEWVIVAVVALSLSIVMQIFLIQAFSIPSGSMEPTLNPGDRVIVYKLGYRFGDINRGDVVVFDNPDQSQSEDLIKRVVALGGEAFELRDGYVYINGLRLDEPYVKEQGVTYPAGFMPGCVNGGGDISPDLCIVPEGKILVLGDNRQASRDGRYLGPVDVESVVGRAFMKYWPPNALGGLG